MKKIILLFIICVLLIGCTKNVTELTYDDSNSFMTVYKWQVYENGRITHYEYIDGLGRGRLTTRWLNMNTMQFETKSVEAKFGELVTGKGFISFKINGIKYVYKSTK